EEEEKHIASADSTAVIPIVELVSSPEKNVRKRMRRAKMYETSLKGQSLPGTLPPEFANLLYLQNIDLTYNFLSGTIPVEWGSMEQATHISLIGNRITGSIPKELGNIRTLTYLFYSIFNRTVEDNLMSGVIPWELGNLASIEFLFLNSNYFTGELPASFANLTNVKQLRIQASGLEGPIPSTITLLSTLSDLRISDLKGPDTLCPPFSNKTSIEYLILRSCNLIGQLPESLASKSLKLVLVFLPFPQVFHVMNEISCYEISWTTIFISLVGNMM
ncbi:probable leucine-rich repeat receptor-like serine/threonine-protein kinase, partial [Tanacetum coccineum]